MKLFKHVYFLTLMLVSTQAFSQINPNGAMYYFNNYLANPAFAGMERDWNISSGVKAQWTAIDGAPVLGYLTLDRGSENSRVGLGLNFKGESLGLIRRTDMKASYAYHLELSKASNSHLDFGLSAGVINEWLDLNKFNGDNTDLSLARFNERKIYLDADFGIAYRLKGLTIQTSIPNLKRFFSRDVQRSVVDRSLFMSAASYKINLDSATINSIEPKFVYRNVEGFGDIYDGGVNVTACNSKLFFSGIYHSTGSTSFGVGMNSKIISIFCMYTTNTSDLANYANGEFEFGLKYSFK